MFFFSLQRSGACNAFDTFFTPMDKKGEKINEAFTANQIQFLRKYRIAVVDNNSKKLQDETIAKNKWQTSFNFDNPQ
jgi:hypothetical protein